MTPAPRLGGPNMEREITTVVIQQRPDGWYVAVGGCAARDPDSGADPLAVAVAVGPYDSLWEACGVAATIPDDPRNRPAPAGR